MITVVEFRANQATKSRYVPTDRLYDNYFFITIDLGWLEQVKCENFASFFWLQTTFSKPQNSFTSHLYLHSSKLSFKDLPIHN